MAVGLTVVAVLAPMVAYAVYVAHYAVNALWEDDWSLVPVFTAYFDGHSLLGPLWAQHNEHRLVVPDLVWLAFAVVGHFDTRQVAFFSAMVFAAAYLTVLATYRRTNGHMLAPLPVLLIGVVWFSLADDESALWAVQMSWYIVTAGLAALLLLLSWPPPEDSTAEPTVGPDHGAGTRRVVAAGVVALIASFSSFQGLLLWPLGAALLAHAGRARSHRRVPGGQLAILAGWCTAGAVTAATYFLGFHLDQTGGKGSVGYAAHHLADTATYYLVLLGNVATTAGQHLLFHEVLGVVVLMASVAVAGRELLSAQRYPLSAGLVLYALATDVFTATARVSLGSDGALSSRYTMTNLLLVVAVGLHLFRPALAPGAGLNRVTGAHASPAGPRRRQVSARMRLVAVSVVAAQAALSTPSGLGQSRALDGLRASCARTATSLSSPSIPSSLGNLAAARQDAVITAVCYPHPAFFRAQLPTVATLGLAQAARSQVAMTKGRSRWNRGL